MIGPRRVFATMMHRPWLSAAVAGGIALIALPALSALNSDREITIVAERYEYSPPSITLKKEETVILHLVSRDRVHGFNVKALGVRADVMPGAEIRVRVTPHKMGIFPFKCDLFCGSGHTDMSGTIVVTD